MIKSTFRLEDHFTVKGFFEQEIWKGKASALQTTSYRGVATNDGIAKSGTEFCADTPSHIAASLLLPHSAQESNRGVRLR